MGPLALPNVFVRALATPLATWTYQMLEHEWLHQFFQVPQHWKDAWLTLLAKRTVKTPKDLRPIAFTDSIGKLVLGVLTTKLRNQLVPTLTTLPLFAYLPGRSTSDALMFAFDHCRQVRACCQAATSSYWDRYAGRQKPLICGGLMISLDLSQAFDRLPRTMLAEGFDIIAPHSTVAPLLLHWLTEARYHITHRGIHTTIPTKRGVRQGCKASPLEWTVFLCALLLRLDLAMWSDAHLWTMQHLITYADDLIARWKIESVADLDRCLRQLSALLDTLAQVGMKVNFQKTVILLRLEGSQRKAIWKRYVLYKQNKPFLRVSCSQGDIHIPIVHEHVYLGTKISYYNFEDRTLKYRLRISRVTFLRLRPLLTGRKALPLTLRIRLWLACIRTSTLHGLDAAGLTAAGCQILHRRFTKDLRSLARSPSRITKESTSDLFRRLGVSLPLEHLAQTWQQHAARKATHLAGLDTFDILFRFDFAAHFRRTLAVLEAAAQAPAPSQDLNCVYCSYVAPTQSVLTRHIHTQHAVQPVTNVFFMLRDAWKGHPQCRHCDRPFPSLRNLRRHITQNNCMLFDANCAWQEPLADSRILRRLILADTWDELWSQSDLLDRLRHECVLCQAWVPDNKQLSAHLRKEHRHIWDHTQASTQILTHRLPSGDCVACAQKGARAHVCPVLRQIVITYEIAQKELTVQTYLQTEFEEIIHPPTALTTPTKRTKSLFVGVISQGSTDRQFQPARDAADGTPLCAHCDTIHNNINSLKRRIETGACTTFDAARPIGTHVPSAWPWLLDLAKDPQRLLQNEDAHKILASFCVLCGRHLRRRGSIITHLHSDHAAHVNKILEQYAHRFADLIPADAPCICDLKQIYEGHRCHLLYQTFLLHDMCQQGGTIAANNPPCLSNPTHEWFKDQWQILETDATLKTTCSICEHECGAMNLLTHLQQHSEMCLITVDMLELAAPPKSPCCCFCDQDRLPTTPCPVSFNLCLKLIRHGPGGTLRHGRGGLHGPDDRLSHGSPRPLPSTGQAKKRRSAATEGPAGLTQALVQVALRHESQLQALSAQDQFVFFLQAGEKGALPMILKQAAHWKDLAQKQQAQGPLRQHLFHHLLKDMMARFELLSKMKSEDPAWQAAIQTQMIMSDGTWPFLRWDPQSRQMKVQPQPGIPMTQMQQLLQELVEISLDAQQILRFKALRKLTDNPQANSIFPWLIQVTLRHNRLWEMLIKLSQNSLWMLAMGRPESITGRADFSQGLTRKIRIPEVLDACLKLQLHNTHNDCCVNANVVAFLWVFSTMQIAHGQTWGTECSQCSSFCPPFRWACRCVICLSGNLFGTNGVGMAHKEMPLSS